MDEESVTDLYDYNAKELLGKSLTILVPSLDKADWKEEMSRLRFFGSATKRGAQFPIIARTEKNTVRITSIPVIAGLMTVNKNGIIEGCNDIFVKYLFGFSQQDLLKKNISLLLPQFTTLLYNLKRDDLLQPGLIMNNIICRKLLIQDTHHTLPPLLNKRLTHTPNNQPLPVLTAIHRDGSPFEVQLQLKLVESDEEEFALWISFDREIVFNRFGHHHLLSTPQKLIKQQTTPAAATAANTKPTAPEKPTEKQEINYSAQTNATNIDDYTILSSLGQGAYGLVKLAVKKNDPTQVIFLLWFIFIL